MMEKQRKKRVLCAADHRHDEPTGLSPGMLASPAVPTSVSPGQSHCSSTLSGGLNFRLPVDRRYLSSVPCCTSVSSLSISPCGSSFSGSQSFSCGDC